jgi:hypothetical protein
VADAISREWVTFGGIVRDAADTPVAGAWVGLEWEDETRDPPEPRRLTTRTAADGAFVFERVLRRADFTLLASAGHPPIQYTLRASAAGHPPIQRDTDLLAPSGEYDLQFP